MLSVCVCTINAKFDLHLFIEALHRHNNDAHFEVCITHDDRVDDGSAEYFEQIDKNYSNLVWIKNTRDDVLDWMNKLMDHYDREGKFTHDVRNGMKENLRKFEAGCLGEKEKNFLWISSGMLYNKAVMASRYPYLMITPGDFMYLFRLKDLYEYMEAKAIQHGGHFYQSPNAIWARISNQPYDWLVEHTRQIYTGETDGNNKKRFDSSVPYKDLLRYPPDLDHFYLPNFRENKIISLGDPDCMSDIKQFVTRTFSDNDAEHLLGFHGMHAMSRKSFDKIGGFTEEWYGRAFADDKMTFLGAKEGPGGHLPFEYSVAWTYPGEILDLNKPDNWQEIMAQVDPSWEKHPYINQTAPVYLHDGLLHNHELAVEVNKQFSRTAKPVRFIT